MDLCEINISYVHCVPRVATRDLAAAIFRLTAFPKRTTLRTNKRTNRIEQKHNIGKYVCFVLSE